MLYRFCTFLLFFFCIDISFAQQNIEGIWEGKKYLENSAEFGNPKFVVEIFNVREDGFFKGLSHAYYKDNYYEHYKLIGMYEKKQGLLVFKEVQTIAVDLGDHGNCLGKYNMVLKVDEKRMFQVGFWQSNIKFCTTNSNVILQKRVEKPQLPTEAKLPKTILPKQIKKDKKPFVNEGIKNTPTLIIPAPIIKPLPILTPKKIAQRETDVQSLLEIAPKDKDSIRIDIYDNGDIDGDIVSVYQDNNLIVNKKTITANALTFYVSLNKNVNPLSHLRLVAESLGSIPPCTAVMIVTTKSKRYEVRLSSNFNKNATVELFLKE